MSVTQLCIPQCKITLFRECLMSFNYNLQPKVPAKTERDRLWNAKLRKLSLRERVQTIRISLLAGSYDNDVIIEFINNTIQNEETLKAF